MRRMGLGQSAVTGVRMGDEATGWTGDGQMPRAAVPAGTTGTAGDASFSRLKVAVRNT